MSQMRSCRRVVVRRARRRLARCWGSRLPRPRRCRPGCRHAGSRRGRSGRRRLRPRACPAAAWRGQEGGAALVPHRPAAEMAGELHRRVPPAGHREQIGGERVQPAGCTVPRRRRVDWLHRGLHDRARPRTAARRSRRASAACACGTSARRSTTAATGMPCAASRFHRAPALRAACRDDGGSAGCNRVAVQVAPHRPGQHHARPIVAAETPPAAPRRPPPAPSRFATIRQTRWRGWWASGSG